MTSTVILSDNGASSGSAGLKSTAGNDGVLILQTTTSGGTATNAVYVDNNQNVIIGANATDSGAKARVVFGSAQNGIQIKDSNDTSNAAFLIFQNGSNSNFATIARDGTNNSLSIGTVSAITFPATQVASAGANTLDDYEEGTWTPAPNSGTFSSASGTYVKVGRLVTITMEANVGTGGGSQVILPFTTSGTVGTGIYMASQTFPSGTTSPTIAIGAAGNTAYFRGVGSGVAFQAMSFTAGAAIHFSISFMIQ